MLIYTYRDTHEKQQTRKNTIARNITASPNSMEKRYRYTD